MVRDGKNPTLSTLEEQYDRYILPAGVGSSGSTFSLVPVLYADSAWPNRPAGDTSISVLWLDPLGESTLDPVDANFGDILIKGAAQ